MSDKRSRIDWPTLRREYVEGMEDPKGDGTIWPTLEEVADKHQATPARVRERAAIEGWTSARDIYRAKREQARQEKRVQILAGRGAEFDLRMLTLAEGQAGLIALRMNELSQIGPDGRRKAPSAIELVKLALALRHVQAVGRIALGEPAGDAAPLPGSVAVRIICDSPALPNFAQD